jgi:hypothetical protein
VSFIARPPDYVLKFQNKRTGQKGRVGAAWLNPNGNLSLILDPKIVLTSDPDEQLTLFPRDEKEATDAT